MKRSAVALAVLLAGCASGPSEPYRVPQVTIAGSVDQAKLTIVQRCIKGGGVVEQNTPTQLICSKPMDDGFGSLLYRAMATPAYSSKPNFKVRYTFASVGDQTFISVDSYLENQNAYGQVKQTPIQNNAISDKAQAMLDEIKAQTEAGATTAAPPPANCKACQEITGG